MANDQVDNTLHDSDEPTIPPSTSDAEGASPPGGGGSAGFFGAIPDPDPAPERIGRYRILHEIGRGGMGVVYLAAHDDDRFRKRVAIKVVKRGVDTDDVLRRFEMERQLLSAMTHPNIARVLDGGATDDGRPYFVMEHIEGQLIDAYCDVHTLSTVERLRLFSKVCSAVQYAHQHLIVHRDLKPANILVTVEGEPKLLDFGIAKLLNPELMGAAEATGPALRLMTPEYASPEQVRGDPITTTSDVYSLGVLLYELLTGHRPYRFKTRLQQEIVRIICEEEPERPSTAISIEEEIEQADGTTRHITPESVAKTREGLPKKLRQRLSGDVDSIVLTALEKSPRRRYDSVEQFTDEIQRYLSRLPLSKKTRRRTWVYVSTKFIRRNKAPVAAAALIMVALLVGLGGATWGWRTAERQRVIAETQRAFAEEQRADAKASRQQVQSLFNVLLGDIYDSVATLNGATKVRDQIVKTGLEYLSDLVAQADDNPKLKRELASALAMGYDQIGTIQGGFRGGGFGGPAKALESFQKSFDLRKDFASRSPEDASLQRDLATSHIHVADALSGIGQTASAEQHLVAAGSILDKLVKANTQDPETLRLRVIYLVEQAQFRKKMGNVTEAVALARESLQLRKRLATLNPSDWAQRDLSKGHNSLGSWLRESGDLQGALDEYQASFNIRQRRAEKFPDDATAQRDLANVHYFIGLVQEDIGDAPGALKSFTAQHDILRELAEADPENARAQWDMATSLIKLGDVRVNNDDLDTARRDYSIAVEIMERLWASRPENNIYAGTTAAAHSRLGNVLLAFDRLDEALEQYQSAHQLNNELAGRDPDNMNYQRSLVISQKKLGDVHLALGDPEHARDDYKSAVELAEKLAAKDQNNARIQRSLAHSYAKLGDALVALAQDEARPPSDRVALWRDARRRRAQSLDIFKTLREQSSRADAHADEIHELEAGLAECDEEITRLKVQ